MSNHSNQAIVITRAVRDTADVPAALKVEQRELPALRESEVLVRSIYASLDPAMLMWIRFAAPYMPLAAGDVLPTMVIGVVEASRLTGFSPGDVVSTFGLMQERFVARASGGKDHDAGKGGVLSVTHVAVERQVPLHLHLSLLSHIGHAAVGIHRIGHVVAGETVLVSAAAGATGSIAAQLAKAQGARVIGVAGGVQKCAWLTDAIGLDGAIDHRGDVAAQLTELAPQGVDLFFDNVGGPLLDTVLLHLAVHARVVVLRQPDPVRRCQRGPLPLCQH
jgi:NADPH-dependent curcumin reductase CurA